MAKTRWATVSWTTVAFMMALASGCSPSATQATAPPASEKSASTAAASPVASAPSPAGLPDFAGLVEQLGQAVVNVEVVGRPRTVSQPFASPEEDPFYDFFRRFRIPSPFANPEGQAPLQRGAGSGFIVTPDGYILTNAHVVAEADEVTVRLFDRREFQAKVVGTDRRTDVALIKIDAKNLPVVRIGDEARLRPGDWVLAIGSPFGLENSVTAGIVSATSRAVGNETDVPFIQTDVAVNPGNSGGPLFNLKGEVVGINSMIFSRTGGYMGISFAIPIEVALHVRDQLLKTGRVVRGKIGVTVQNVDAALAQSFGLDRPRGALVSSVEEGGPADKAGIKPGDVILEVDEQSIDQTGGLSNYISRRSPGQESTVTLWRGGKEKKVDVRIAELKEASTGLARNSGDASSEEGVRLGVAVRSLTDEEKASAEIEAGVRVLSVSGPAALAGVQVGDVILAINSREVQSPEALREAVKKLREGSVAALLVLRGEGQIFIPVRVGKASE
jgi:serine protease Do